MKTLTSYDKNTDQWLKGKKLAHDYLEKPAMYSKLPKLKGKTVLCLGCGAGEECAHIKSLGAKKVVGIDISKELIKKAKANYPDIEFHIMNLKELKFPDSSFDFVYSSLALHYVKDWIKLLKNINKTMKKGSVFLFSTHDPVFWGRDDYLNPRKVNDIWFESFKVTYYHKPFSLMIKEIVESNFEILDCLEPKPLDTSRKIDKSFWEKKSKTPLFVIFELKKK